MYDEALKKRFSLWASIQTGLIESESDIWVHKGRNIQALKLAFGPGPDQGAASLLG